MGAYVALFLNQPYLGEETAPAAAKFKASGARLVIVDRQLPLAELDRDPAFRDLDKVLFNIERRGGPVPFEDVSSGFPLNLLADRKPRRWRVTRPWQY